MTAPLYTIEACRVGPRRSFAVHDPWGRVVDRFGCHEAALAFIIARGGRVRPRRGEPPNVKDWRPGTLADG